MFLGLHIWRAWCRSVVRWKEDHEESEAGWVLSGMIPRFFCNFLTCPFPFKQCNMCKIWACLNMAYCLMAKSSFLMVEAPLSMAKSSFGWLNHDIWWLNCSTLIFWDRITIFLMGKSLAFPKHLQLQELLLRRSPSRPWCRSFKAATLRWKAAAARFISDRFQDERHGIFWRFHDGFHDGFHDCFRITYPFCRSHSFST